MVHGCNIVIFLMIYSAFASKHVDSTEWIIPYMFFVVHRLMVSMKYASLSESEYDKMVNCQDPAQVNKVIFKFDHLLHLTTNFYLFIVILYVIIFMLLFLAISFSSFYFDMNVTCSIKAKSNYYQVGMAKIIR